MLDLHAVAGTQHVERDALVAQGDLALRAGKIGHFLPAVIGHVERLRVVANLLHDPAAGERALGDDLGDVIVVLDRHAVALFQAGRLGNGLAVDGDHVLRPEGQLDDLAFVVDDAQHASVKILGQHALELDLT